MFDHVIDRTNNKKNMNMNIIKRIMKMRLIS